MIPNVIHKIWFGHLPDRYRDSIINWKKTNYRYEVKLWCSLDILTDSQKEHLINFCQASGVILCNIDEDRFSSYPNIDIVRAWLKIPDDLVGKNRFAPASDILRVSVLEEEGGHYSDTDVDALEPLDLDISCHSGSYQGLQDVHNKEGKMLWLNISGYVYAYCVMGAERKHKINILANKHNKTIHDQIFNLLLQTINEESEKPQEADKEREKMPIDIMFLGVNMTGLAVSTSAACLGITPYAIKISNCSHNNRHKIISQESKFAKWMNIRFDNSYYYDKSICVDKLRKIERLCQERWTELTDNFERHSVRPRRFSI